MYLKIEQNLNKYLLKDQRTSVSQYIYQKKVIFIKRVKVPATAETPMFVHSTENKQDTTFTV